MKKIVISAVILLLVNNIVSAQSFHFGLKGGVDMHKIDGARYADEFKAGYHIGAFAEIGLPGKIGIQTEVYFSHTNTKTVYTGAGFTGIEPVKLNYLNIPILLNIKVVPLLSFQIGPQFGIETNRSKSLLQNGKDVFKSGDVGIAAGLQLNVTKIKVYARYIAGINDVNNVNSGKWHNQSIHLGVGFRIF